MNREKLAQMERAIAADYGNIAGMTVLRDGGTVYESYFGDCTDKSRIHVFSVTKSVVSILFGIALDRGYLDGIDRRVLDFFPEKGMVVAIASRFKPAARDRIEFIRKYVGPAFGQS